MAPVLVPPGDKRMSYIFFQKRSQTNQVASTCNFFVVFHVSELWSMLQNSQFSVKFIGGGLRTTVRRTCVQVVLTNYPFFPKYSDNLFSVQGLRDCTQYSSCLVPGLRISTQKDCLTCGIFILQ